MLHFLENTLHRWEKKTLRWKHSHEFRGHLCRAMGLLEVAALAPEKEERIECIYRAIENIKVLDAYQEHYIKKRKIFFVMDMHLLIVDIMIVFLTATVSVLGMFAWQQKSTNKVNNSKLDAMAQLIVNSTDTNNSIKSELSRLNKNLEKLFVFDHEKPTEEK